MTTKTQRQWPLAFGLMVMAAALSGRETSAQTVERDTTITGPRGNSIERQVRTERRGNVVDRQIDITRPGGTYHRETQVTSPPGYRGGPVYRGGPRIVERDVFIGGGAPAPFFNFFVGSPPPPVFIAPFPPPLVVNLPPIASGPPPRPVGVDQAADAIDEFGSFHMKTRREAAITLGKLRDHRGVPPLIDRLKHDHEKEVRMAAAWSLAEIGDPRAVVPLEVAAQFDKRPDVQAVARKSLARMPRDGAPSGTAVRIESGPARSSGASAPAKTYNLDDLPPPDPTPAAPRSEPDPGFGYPR